jgi:hypothetical protein
VAHVDLRRRHVNLLLVEEEGEKGEEGNREKGKSE